MSKARLHVVLQPSLRKWTCPKMDMPENGRALGDVA